MLSVFDSFSKIAKFRNVAIFTKISSTDNQNSHKEEKPEILENSLKFYKKSHGQIYEIRKGKGNHGNSSEFLQKFYQQIRKTLQKKKKNTIGFQNSHKEEKIKLHSINA